MPLSSETDIPLVPASIDPDRLGVCCSHLPGARVADAVADLKRLTRQPIWFRWLQADDDKDGRVLIKVDSPPPHIVLRVLDGRKDSRSEPDARSEGDAYSEQAPGVWIPIGYRHPAIDRVRPPANHFVLVGPNGDWEAITAGEFVEEIDTLPLAVLIQALVAGSRPSTIAARIRLVRAGESDSPRLWVLREDALGQLTTYCKSAHQQLLARFAVSVSATAGVPCVILRATTAKGPPPVFVGSAVAYYSTLKFPNLFLPAATRLAPPLRREAIQQPIGARPHRVVWLHPLADGAFRAESLPETAFRPLQEWVEYRVTEPARATHPWIQSHRWDFEPFVVRRPVKSRPERIVVTPAPESA